ncbi:MAG: regulatory protein RecX [Alkalispirochaeta sp.]
MERRRTIRFDIARGRLDSQDGMAAGDRTNIGRLRDLVIASEDLFVKPVALEILARRDHSDRELRTKLRRRGFSVSVIDSVLRELSSLGYQSDQRFAESWVRSAMRRGDRSRNFLIAGLQTKGVSRDLAEQTIYRYAAEHPGCFDTALLEALRQTVRRVAPDAVWEEDTVHLSFDARKSVTSRLIRRGFSTKEIQRHFA